MALLHLPRTVGLCCAVGLIALGATACGDSTAPATAPTITTTTPTTTTAGTTPSVGGQWARRSPTGATTGVAYFTITSPVADRLMGVSVDTGVAMMAQLHESTMGTDGQMAMQPVDGVDLKAGVPFVLQPGGYHVMLMQLAKPLTLGTTVVLTVTLQKAGKVTIEVPVRDEAP